jgi:PhnB protein
VHVQPYLFFDGRCEEAMTLYRDVLGAEVSCLMRFGDSPDPAMLKPGTAEKVMHATFRLGDLEVMASDGECNGRAAFQGFSLSVTMPTDEAADRAFARLGEGGQVQMPMARTFFARRFGMVADRFGVSWMVLAGVDDPPAASAGR